MYTNQTTHYAIPLPLGTDLTTPMDYNESMQAIDTAVWGAVQDAATATSDAANAVETANGAASDVGTLGGRVNTLEATVETQGNAIVGLVNTTTSQGTAIGNKFNSVAVADAYSPTSTYSVGDVVTFEGNRYKCITAVTTGEPFDVDKWQGEDIQTVIDAINTDLSDINTDLESIGTIVESTTLSSVISHTWRAMRSLTLGAGTWIIRAYLLIDSDSDGIRQINIANTNGDATVMVTANAVDGADTSIEYSFIVHLTSESTFYLNALQSSSVNSELSINRQFFKGVKVGN